MTNPWRERLGYLLELIAMCALVIAQPVFNTFQGNATDLVFRRTGATDLILFAIIVTLLPPVVLWLAETAVGLVRPETGRIMHVCLLGILAGIFAVEVAKELTDLAPGPLIAIGIVAVLAMVVARHNVELLGKVLRYLIVAPVLFVLSFLFASPITGVAFADGTAEAARLEMDNPVDVVLITFDELATLSLLDEADDVDAELWPAFADLAAESTWYRNNASVAPTTPTAIPALFTGQLPTAIDTLPQSENHPQNIFTMLGSTHDLNVHESVSLLCPNALCATADAKGGTLGSLLDDAVVVWREFASPRRSSEEPIDFTIPQSDPSADTKITEWINRIEPGGDGVLRLDLIHTILPHQPWWRVPDGRRYDAPVVAEGLEANYAWGPDTARLSAQQRHLMQLQWTDVQLGRMVGALKQQGRWDDALVIVTVDHGVSFEIGDPIRGLGFENESRVAWSPLFVKYPGQIDGVIDERPTQTLDVVPTIVDVLGAEAPWELDGQSLLEERTADDRVFADWSLSTRKPDDGGIFARLDGEAGYSELLAADPVVAPGDPALRIYRWGAYGDLVGTEAGAYPIGPSAELTIDMDDDYSPGSVSYDPAADRIPVYVAGTLNVDRPVDVAFSVNGTIAGWGRSKVVAGGHRVWSVLIPELIQPGSNTVALFEIRPGDDGVTLLPIPTVP